MSSRGAEQTPTTHDDVARRDVLIEELTRSQRRLQDLYEISRILLRFETIERTVPEVMALVAHTVPLRSAIFVKTKNGSHALVFQAAGQRQTQLAEAKTHAAHAYGYLVPSDGELGLEQASAMQLPAQSELELEQSAEEGAQSRFVLLPLVVNRGAIFGALQVAGMQPLGELELVFVSAVVNQLATALDRDCVERALRTSEAKLAGILSMAVDAVITVDETMHIAMYNAGAERIFGWSPNEILGRPIELLLPRRFREAHRQHTREFQAATDTTRKMGARLPAIYGRRKDGEEFLADAAISKLNIDGSWLFTVFLRDISEQKRVEREKAFLAEVSAVLSGTLDNDLKLGNIARLAMGDFADFCVIEFLDERGEQRRLEVSSAEPEKTAAAMALKLFPLDRTRPHLSSVVLQSSQSQLVTEVSPALLRSVAPRAPHLRLYESMGLRSLIGVPLLVGGRLLGALIVATSRPDRQFDEADLHLLTEVGQRAALALESARLYRVAQRAIQVRDDVLGVVAHDLRNPLGTILMQTDLMQRKGAEPDRRARRPGDVIDRAARRMNRLIQDLLDITSIDAGHLSIERTGVVVRQVMSDLLDTQQPLAASRSLELRRDATAIDLEIWADRERLFQVLENLVGNAIKFTPAGGTITVGARRQGVNALLWVSDTGAGIEASDLSHLFDRFWQVKKSARRGAGLGLAIVKGLVESHGGRIWVESVLGQGSTFYFTIPIVVH